MSIKIGSKIEKLNPADIYKLIDGKDVGGFDGVFVSARISGGKMYATNASGVEIVIGDVGRAVNLKTGQLPMMGSAGDLVYSGVTVTPDGLVRVPANTIAFGDPMTLGTATGFALLHNVVTEKSYMILDASLSEADGSGRPTQFFTEPPAEVVLSADGTSILTSNPLTFSYTTQFTATTFSLIFNADSAMKNVKIRIVDSATGVPFKYFPSRVAWDDPTVSGFDFPAGKSTINMFSDKPSDPANGKFNIGYGPITLAKDWVVGVEIKADNINIKGSAAGMPMMSALMGKASFRGMAYQDEIGSGGASTGVVSVGIDANGRLSVTHSDGTVNLINLPASPNTALATRLAAAESSLQQQGVDVAKIKADYGRVDAKLTELEGVYVYSGDTPAPFTDQPKAAYFVNLHSTAARDVTMVTPNPAGGNINGAMLHVTNSNAASTITFNAPAGFTINGAASYSVPANSFAVFVLDGADWKLVEVTGTGTQRVPLTSDEVMVAVDNGTPLGPISIKSLANGWWYIPAGLVTVTGRPPNATGDMSVFRQSVTDGSASSFVVVMAFGFDAIGRPSMWAQYRSGTVWTAWLKVNESASLTSILSDITSLKAGDKALSDRLSTLSTAVGGLYSPSKIAFDAAVNALIDAKIKTSQTEPSRLPTSVPKIYAYYGQAVAGSLGAAGIFSSTSGVVQLTRAITDGQRIFIAVQNDAGQAADVSGVSVDNAIAAKWASRDQTYNNVQYRTFYSSTAYYQVTNKIEVKFGSTE